MPAWLAPLISGVAATAGGLFQNSANRAEAQRNRDWQERMSSTAAQRSAKDYAAAGLNPALAYSRTAPMGGGAQASNEDVVGPGISSALGVQRMRADLALTKAQTEKTDAEAAVARSEAAVRGLGAILSGQPSYMDEKMAERMARIRDFGQTGKLQPFELRIRELEKELLELKMPGARNEARLDETLGRLRPGAPLINSTALMLSRFLSGRR